YSSRRSNSQRTREVRDGWRENDPAPRRCGCRAAGARGDARRSDGVHLPLSVRRRRADAGAARQSGPLRRGRSGRDGGPSGHLEAVRALRRELHRAPARRRRAAGGHARHRRLFHQRAGGGGAAGDDDGQRRGHRRGLHRRGGAGMKRLLAALALFATSAFAQTSIISIQEVDEDGNQIALADKSRIVDINSTLNLTIDRNQLNKYLEQKGLTGSASDLVARIDALSEVLRREDASLQKLQQVFATDPGPSASLKERKAHWEQTAAAAADAALLVNNVPELNSYLNALLVQNPQQAMNPIEQYRLVYVAAANIARDLQTQVDNVATTNGVYVQLGAWLETTPIHIEGFDDYPTGEHYVVQRWNLALSADEQARLNAYAELATKVNADGVKALLSWKTIGPSIIQAYLQDTQSGQCAASLSSNYAAAKSQTWASAADVQAKLAQGQKDAQDYVDFLEGLKKAYSVG